MGNLVLPAGSGDAYEIKTSLLSDTATDWMGYTCSTTGDTKTWSYSAWFKRGSEGAYPSFFRSLAQDGSNDWDTLRLEGTTNQLYYYILENNVVVYSRAWELRHRDLNNWYHVLLVYDTTEAVANDRIKLYIDGVIQPYHTGSNPPLNYTGCSTNRNLTVTYQTSDGGNSLDGYTAEAILVTDVAASPSDFGEAHPDSVKAWRPIDPTNIVSTGGANSFWLKFDKNAANLGIDSSGKGNNFSVSGFTSASNGTYDSPTNNFCTLNGSLNNANIVQPDGRYVSHSGGAWDTTYGSMAVDSGKWYFETKISVLGGFSYHRAGICRYNEDPNAVLGGTIDSIGFANATTGQLHGYRNGAGQVIDASFTDFVVNDVIMIALDLDTKQMWVGKNGTWYGDPVAKTGDAYNGLTGTWMPAIGLYGTSAQYLRFSDASHSYTPPTGFHGWESKYFEHPPLKDPTDAYQVTWYAGNGSASRSIGYSNVTDFAMFKNTSTVASWSVFDSLRGATKELHFDNANVETTDTNTLISFDTTGVTIGDDALVNAVGSAYLGTSFTKNPDAGFDIQTYTGTGAAQTINHDLGVAPKLIIVKNRDVANSWGVYHSAVGEGYYLRMDVSSAKTASASAWNNTAPGASSFTVGANLITNDSGDDYIAYLFADVRGLVKMFSYTGNGSTDGTYVHCGFQPHLVILKCPHSIDNWVEMDIKQDVKDADLQVLYPNLDSASVTLTNGLQFTKDGFKVRESGSAFNTASQEYVGIAIAYATHELLSGA